MAWKYVTSYGGQPAVEEQTATTREIANNISQASTGIQEANENVAQCSTVSSDIAGDIATVNNDVGEMTNSSSVVKINADELSKLAEQLNGVVGRFKFYPGCPKNLNISYFWFPHLGEYRIWT